MSHLANFESQRFGWEVLNGGVEVLENALQVGGTSSQASLMACEIIAASNGRPVLKSGWCFFAESWLYKSKYIPSESEIKNAIKLLDNIIANGDQVQNNAADLHERLSSPPKKLKRSNPVLTQNSAKAMVKKFGPHGSYGIERNILYGNVPSISDSIKLSAYPKLDGIETSIGGLPREELIQSFRFLLLANSKTLTRIKISYIPHYDEAQNEYESLDFLKECLDELSMIANLDTFMTDTLEVNDDIVSVVAEHKLEIFAADIQVGFPKSDLVEITSNGVEKLIQCKSLEMIRIASRHLNEKDGQAILTAIPNVNLFEVPR